ncbi:MAG: hypothetical protein ABW133_08660 [Polyangiaceae bacterium]
MKVVFTFSERALTVCRTLPPYLPSSRTSKFGLLSLLSIIALAIGCGSKPAPSAASPTGSADAPTSANGFGVLVMAHGGEPEWNQAVLDTVDGLKKKYPIEVAFGMADATTIQEGVKKLEARNVRKIGVVRLFISGESWYSETEQILGLKAGAPDAASADPHAGHHGAHGAPASSTTTPANPHAHHGAPPGDPHAAHGGAQGNPHGGHGGHQMAFFRIATNASFAMSKEGLADADGMGAVLADRAAELSKDPAREDVLILAHGPGDDQENARWLAKLDARAGAVRSRLPLRRVQVETLREDWPDKRVDAEKRIRAFAERAIAEGGKAIVIPYRVQGFGPYAKVLEGIDYKSSGKGLIPHAEVFNWIERQVKELEAGEFRAPVAK